MPNTDHEKLSVTIIYPFIAHYRLGVFQELLREPTVAYSLITGSRPPNQDIPLAQAGAVQPLKVVRNLWMGSILFQPYAIVYAFRSKATATIFAGDIRYVSTWIAALVLRLRRRRVLFWTIGWHRPESGLRRLIRIAFYRLANDLLLYGETGRSIGIAVGYPANRIHTIGNSCGLRAPDHGGSTAPSPVTRIQDEGAFRCSTVVGAVIRPQPIKRLDLLVRAVHLLRQGGLDVGVAIIGEGSCRESLGALAAELEVPISVPGGLYSESELRSAYDRILVTVVPEAVGLTAIQSLSRGRPVISCDDIYRQMPEYESIRPGVTGDLYKTGDVRDLARTIHAWILRMDVDRDAIEQACKEEVVRNWTATAHARRITDAVVGATATDSSD